MVIIAFIYNGENVHSKSHLIIHQHFTRLCKLFEKPGEREHDDRNEYKEGIVYPSMHATFRGDQETKRHNDRVEK
jgi:hypothetical protein